MNVEAPAPFDLVVAQSGFETKLAAALSQLTDLQPRAVAPAVSVVIPTLNEARNLPHVLSRIPDEYEVVLVDGHSTDGTVEVARAIRPSTRVVYQRGRGKGDALRAGFEVVSGDVIVMLDADGSARPEEIRAFIDALVEGADFAKGSRFLEGGGSADITRLRMLGNRLLTRFVNILFGTAYTDLCYGFNAFWRYCLSDMNVDCDGFEVETLINIRVARSNLCAKEVPSYEEPRLYGTSNLHAFRDGWRVLVTIVRERLRPPRAKEVDPVVEFLRDLHRRVAHSASTAP